MGGCVNGDECPDCEKEKCPLGVKKPLLDGCVESIAKDIPKEILVALAQGFEGAEEYDGYMSQGNNLQEMAENIIGGVLYSKIYKMLVEGLSEEDVEKLFLTVE